MSEFGRKENDHPRGFVVVAMSGGVDSSVAAALLKRAGFSVVGITMRLWTAEQPDCLPAHRSCCSVETVDDARRVCQILDIPFYVLNFEREFREHVVNYFCRDYERGRTPNPCIACNEWIKFRFLLQKSLALGADYIATGHYARVEEAHGKYSLLRAADKGKDQSYVLYMLTQNDLAHLLLPIGHYEKGRVRQLAADFGLPVADKRDSQDICFIPDSDYRRFIRNRVNTQSGDIVDIEGRILGRHEGVAFYTVGQRHGLGLAAGRRFYVTGVDAANNRVIVGPKSELLRYALSAESVNYISGEPPTALTEVTARIRYRSEESPATLFPGADGVKLRFKEPQRAITPGQAVVFYSGEAVVGGGTIVDSQSNL